MVLAWISLGALLTTIILSCTSKVNPGVVAIVFAWIIGAYLGPICGKPIDVKSVAAGFPVDLFLTLLGVTLLFGQAQGNGTLEWITEGAVQSCRGNLGLMPVMFFGLALTIASIGAGNIATAALVAPMAMAVAVRVGIPVFLMAIMVAHGSIAGALSPLAPTGIIANSLMTRMGMSGFEVQNYLANLVGNALVAVAGFLIFGGWRLFFQHASQADENTIQDISINEQTLVGTRRQHIITLGIITALVISVVGFKVHVGMGALAASALLTLGGLADEGKAVRAIPWSVIVMVCGVTVLTALLEQTGGLDLFTTALAKFSTQKTVTGIIALVTGLVSVYSSTSGVVLPTFLPSVPSLVQKLGGGDPLAITSSILVGGHLVDVSPLSTIGALCVAGAASADDRRRLFNQMLAWGLAMAFVGALGCYLVF